MHNARFMLPITAIALLGWLVSPVGAEDGDDPEAAEPAVIPPGAFLNEVGEVRQLRYEGVDVGIAHGEGETLQLSFHNRGDTPCDLTLSAEVSKMSSIPMGRMGPLQVQLHQEQLLVRLAPGQRMVRTISTTPPAVADEMVPFADRFPMDMFVVVLSRPNADTPSLAALRIAAPAPDSAAKPGQ